MGRKINIAIFSPSRDPYSETFIQAHKNYLRDIIFYYYGIGTDIKLENFNSTNSFLRRLILKIRVKLLKHPSHIIWSLDIIKSLKKNKIDSILIEYGNHAYSLLPVLKKLKIPVVVHFHGADASKYKVIKDCLNYRDVFLFAYKIIVVSKVMEQKLLDLGCPRNKLVYNVNSPQPEFHEVKANFKKKQFIGIGRFTDKKAPYYTILAFKEVLDKHPDAKLLLAGQGALLNMCKNLVKVYGLERNIFFLGVITPEEYRKHLTESLAFVQHSITALDGDMEGTPLAVLEASAAGLPVIATKHAGIPDVVLQNETGLLSDEHDVKGMTENMFKVLDDNNYAKALGATGKKRIRENFNLETHISNIQNILQRDVK